MPRNFFFILFLLILPGSVWMQTGEAKNAFKNPPDSPSFERFVDEDGLPISGVTWLFQDSKGFLWVGSYVALYRFDGYRFASYTNDPEVQNSISDVNITSICETKAGQIWIGTTKGLNKYDQATDSFRSYKFDADNPNSLNDNYVQAIFEDSLGTLWIGTNDGGLSKFDASSGIFTKYKFPASNRNRIVKILEDHNGGFWVATEDGLKKFDRLTGTILETYRFDSQNPNSLSNNIITSMIIDQAGYIWLGTIKGGLNKFDPISGRFTRYTADKNKTNSLNDNIVGSIYQAKSGTLWIGTASGLNRYSPETDDFTVYQHDSANPRSLSKGEILSIFEDNNEQLWVGSIGGLDKFNQKMNRFQRFRHDVRNPNSISNDEIISIFEDKNENLWIGTRRNGQSGELNKYDLKTKQFEIVKNVGDAIVYSIYQDRNEKLWFGTLRGLISFDPGTNRFTTYQDYPSAPDNLNEKTALDSVITLKGSRAADLLIGTIGGGMIIFNPSLNAFKRFNYDPDISVSAAKNRVFAIHEDKPGNLWIGTGEGLYKLEYPNQNFIKYKHDPNDPSSLSASDVSSIYEDKSGTIWIGTTSGGLNRLDRATQTFARFSQRDGLPSNDVFDIVEDEHGNLWLCTDRGLARFNIETHNIRIFNVNDGVPNNPFDNKTVFKTRSGELYFGGQDGFVKFDPKDFTDSDIKPPIVLTDIRVLEKPLKTTQNIAEIKELDLSWRDYVVSFDFAALDFTDPKKLQYQWKLEGFDDDWINGGTRRTATYTNLPGGNFVLKVKATNVDGVWSEESLNLKINVEPPFYRTFWFLGLIILTVSALIWLLYRNRIRQLHAISAAQTKFTQQLITSQETERKRIAAELHDGLGQNLVVIKNRAMLGIKRGNDTERVAKELRSISESASQALDEVREITNNLRPQLLDRLGLTKAVNAMLKKVSGVIEIESEIESIDNIFNENEEISVYRIVQESLNNIIKHANATKVAVNIKRNEYAVLITIEDNGNGFDSENVISGLGLVGLKERSQLLNGELKIDSKIGEGTKIQVAIEQKG